MPLISVVIPAYNYGRYLPCAINSILDQNGLALEVVIVDDCSTDDTPQQVTPFLADPRLRYLRNANNLGAVRNINKAVSEARGDFILLLGADDFLLPGSLAALLTTLEKYPEAGFAYGNYVFADENDTVLNIVRHPGHIPAELPPWRDDFPDLLKFDHYINLGTTLFRRPLIEKYGFFDPLLSIDDFPGRFFRATDWDLCLRLSLTGVRSAFVYSTLSAFRIHSTQASVGGDFDREGIALREFSVLLERYLQPENAARLIGHEQAILKLIRAKRAEFTAKCDLSTIADLTGLKKRLKTAELFLQELATEPLNSILTTPRISVIVVINDNPQEFLPTLTDLEKQTDKIQVLVINRGKMDLSKLLRPWRSIHIPGASIAAARCYGVQLTDGEALCFIDAGCRLAPEHLAIATQAISQAGTPVVQAQPESNTLSNNKNDDTTWALALTNLLPEGHPWRQETPPLSTFVIRRTVYLRLGGFDKSLTLLDDLDFLLRLQQIYPIQSFSGNIQPVSMFSSLLIAAREHSQPNIIADSLKHIANHQRNTSTIKQENIRSTEPDQPYSSPLFTIILTTFNRPFLLIDALHSVDKQTFRNFEAIVINDNGEPVEHLLSQLKSNITLINHDTNRGVSAARNTGLSLARGKYVTYLDDDDLILPNHLAVLAQEIERHPNSVIYTDAEYITETIESERRIEHSRKPPYEYGDFSLDQLLIDNYIPINTVCHPRDLIDTIGHFDESLSAFEDWEFLLRAVKKIHFYHIKKTTVEVHRRADTGLDHLLNLKKHNFPAIYRKIYEKHPTDHPETQEKRFELIKKIADLTANVSLDDEYQNWLAQRKLIGTDTLFLDQAPPYTPSFQVIVRLPLGFESRLADTIDSLGLQIHEGWHLDVVSPIPSPEGLEEIPNIIWHMLNSADTYKDIIDATVKANSCDWTIELPAGAKLDTLYLWRLANEILSVREKHALFVDDDCIDENGHRHSPRFKPGTNPGHLQASDLAGPLCVHKDIWITSGGAGQDNGSPWYDQLLRIAEKFGWETIHHVSDILITYSNKFPSNPAACQASLRDSLRNRQIEGEIRDITEQSWDIRYALKTPPTVTIAILSQGQLEFISRCINSLITTTQYPAYEIIIITNELPEDTELDRWLKQTTAHSRLSIRFIYTKKESTHASRCNTAIASSENNLIALVREETVFVQETWLEELVRACEPQDVSAASPLVHRAGDAKIIASGKVLGLINDIASPYSGKAELGDAGYLDCLLVTRDVTTLPSACLIVRKASYLEVGGMDETELGDFYGEVDLCLKMRKRGQRLIVHPRASIIYGGDTSEYDPKRRIKEMIVKTEAGESLHQRWGKTALVDPYWNINLSLSNIDPRPETAFRAQWQYLPSNKPRILAHPLGNGQGDYRVTIPLTAIRKAGLAMECIWRQATDGMVRHFTAAEITRLEPTSLIVQNYIHDVQLAVLDEWERSNCRPFLVYTIDDLINDLDKTNPFRKNIPPNARSRLKYALARCDRLVVSTDFLAESYKDFIGDIRVVPNRLQKNIWCPLSSLKRTSKKPRIGWAGGSTHQGDLLLLKEVIAETRGEADWVFFGMCPDDIRPLLAEYHETIHFYEYPAYLSSLNLDIAVAPLSIHPFNQGKSNLRLLEYGVLGIPVVCTDIDPYRNSPACCVENTPKAWIAALRERIHDHEGREREGAAMRQWVYQSYLLEDHLNDWLSAHLPN